VVLRRPCGSLRPCGRAGHGGASSAQWSAVGVPGAVSSKGPSTRPLAGWWTWCARSRQDDGNAFLERLGAVRPAVPKLLIWDTAPLWNTAPPHPPKRVLATAEATHITSAWRPFRAPELNPLEERWRLLKAVVAATRGLQDPGHPRSSRDHLDRRPAPRRAAHLLRRALVQI
jgi:hypothetical protein